MLLVILALGTSTEFLLFEGLVQLVAQFKNSFRILFLREFFRDEAPKANGFERRGIRHEFGPNTVKNVYR